MKRALAAAGLLLLATPARPEVMVRVSGVQVELQATAAPLADVLDRLARQTGMKVVYEGPAPRQLVTLAVHARSPVETVLALLEGQGLNFAMVGDATGSGVATLVLAGAVGTSPSSSSSSAYSPRPNENVRRGRRSFTPPGSSPDAMEPVEADEQDEAEPDQGDSFLGMPSGMESDPSAVLPPDPNAQPAPVAEPTPLPPGAGRIPGGPIVPQQAFPVSPFAPQPQPYPTPAVPPGMPPLPGSPPPDDGAVPGSIPPP
jgi:hypothetical protein